MLGTLKPRRAWFQFSLRTLVLVTAAFAAYLSWRSCAEKHRQELIAEIQALEGNVSTEPAGLFPTYAGERVTKVELPSSQSGRLGLHRLRSFPALREVSLTNFHSKSPDGSCLFSGHIVINDMDFFFNRFVKPDNTGQPQGSASRNQPSADR